MFVESLDHIVLTVVSIEHSLDFYTRVLGMEAVVFGQGRHAVRFGAMRIHLHKAGQELSPKAHVPMPGSADLCFLTRSPVESIRAHLVSCQCIIEIGPVKRQGAAGDLHSVYVRDPDANLIEIACVPSL